MSESAQIGKRPRRWLAFSLRALLAFTLLACLVAAYFGNLWRHVQQQRTALANLDAAGYGHTFSYEFEPEERRYPPGPWILRALLGDDVYAKVEVIQNKDDATTSVDDLRFLADLPQTRRVALQGDWVTDEAIEHLARVRGLEGVHLGYTRVTPIGVSTLAQLAGLKSVGLVGPNINDECLTHLHELPRLELVTLGDVPLTSVGISNLGKIASLRELHLYGNMKGVDAEGLKHLPQLRRLDRLKMYRIDLDAACLTEIGRIKSLKSSQLTRCGIVDPSARGLSGLSELETLSLGDMPVADGWIEAMTSMRRLRSITIVGSGLTDERFLKLAELKDLQQIIVGDSHDLRRPKKLVTVAAAKTFAQQLPGCNVYVGDFSREVRKYERQQDRR